ncbi:MAG: hypothetical protein RJB38_1639 [Pseudomonadota bacterium]|jgi:hypothetical protein
MIHVFKRLKRAALIGATMILTTVVTSTNAAASNRVAKRFGLGLGLLGDPAPSVLGYQVSYNLSSFLRAIAGYGSISGTTTSGTVTLTTIGGGARFFVPGWNFSPVAGLSYAQVSLTGSGSLSGFGASGSHIYATAGFDWQAANGFNLGFGANISTKDSVGALPYLNFGWYF